jgi:hypothetical protein
MAQLLASGTAEAESTTFDLAAGDVVTLSIFGTHDETPSQVADVQIKGSDNGYTNIGQLRNVSGEAAKVLSSPGTYRVRRRLCTAAFGVDKV